MASHLEIHGRILSCLQDIGVEAVGAEGVTRLALAALVAWREGHDDIIRSSKARLLRADAEWLNRILASLPEPTRDDLAFRIGYGASGTPLEAALEVAETSRANPALAAMRRGLTEGILRTLSFGTESSRRDPDAGPGARNAVLRCSRDICAIVLCAILDGLERKPLLHHLNIVILLEEAMLEMSGWIEPGDGRRRTAIDYALTRLLAGMATLEDASMEDITMIFRRLGNMARLNRQVSDGFDRVQAYAKAAARDPDRAEAGRLSGRPEVGSHDDIHAAARQCRMFRDRERV